MSGPADVTGAGWEPPQDDTAALVDKARKLLAKVPEPPWFTADDDAEDAPDHAGSGLALVDTGRREDWPIARLCEWSSAKLISWCGDGLPKLLDLITTQAHRIAALEAALAAKEMTEERIRELRKKYWETNEMGIFAGLSIALDIVRSLTPPEALARREAERRVIEAARMMGRDGYAQSKRLQEALKALAALDQANPSTSAPEEPHGD